MGGWAPKLVELRSPPNLTNHFFFFGHALERGQQKPTRSLGGFNPPFSPSEAMKFGHLEGVPQPDP